MALATHQVQGSYQAIPTRVSWNRGIKLRRFVTTLFLVERTDRFISVKCKSCLRIILVDENMSGVFVENIPLVLLLDGPSHVNSLKMLRKRRYNHIGALCPFISANLMSCFHSVGAPFVLGPKGKSFKISAFKAIGQNVESGGRASGTKPPSNPVKFSWVPKESEHTLTNSAKVKNVPVSYTSEADESKAGSAAIQKLFKNWLTLLRTPSSHQMVDESVGGASSRKISDMQNGIQNKERGEILKVIWCYFLGLDAAIKMPLLIFIPFFLAVNVIYGADVSKELTPLWIIGPLIVALYVKMFQGLWALYAFSFKQTVKVVKNLPTYCLLAYNCMTPGEFKKHIRAYLWQPLLDIKNKDYKELLKRKMTDIEGWLVEKYVDFVETIWPYYNRTIRFFKRANLL
ncbi:unnamed protein product [Ilex paraguariensis]|uniref:Embryo defective 2759 n=1 Tax=Ilex paraguariensis TaxID=185542 RepID=A0ABC8R0Q6_9AQUA